MISYPYLLELRLGHAKPKLNAIIKDVKDQFNLASESPNVAHMTLYGPFAMKSGHSFHEVKSIISQTARNISTLQYWVNGYDHKFNPNGGVITFRITPSTQFENFLTTTSKELQKITSQKAIGMKIQIALVSCYNSIPPINKANMN